MTPRGVLVELFERGLASVHGGAAVERSLAGLAPREERFVLLAVGKAACAMAEGARAVLGEQIGDGVVTTKVGHARSIPGLEVLEASHPLPDERSVGAAERALDLAARPGDETRLVLLSGGASALWTAPRPPLSLAGKQAVTDGLLRAGADIHELNTVRRHLSRIKGGGLARACGGRPLLTLALSDVAGDAPETIGSGPTVGDPTTLADARAVLEARGPQASWALEARTCLEQVVDTLKPDDPLLGASRYVIVGSLRCALAAVRSAAEARGLRVSNAPRGLTGEARALAPLLAARSARQRGSTDLLLAGGEPTVTVRGAGRGGRAQELALAFAIEIDGLPDVVGLFAGTDGTDGPTSAAGAVVDGGSASRIRAAGRDPRRDLDANDSFSALEAAGDLLHTGPTDTNVTDLALILLGAPRSAS